MPKKELQHYFKYIFFVLFILVAILAFFIIRPFLGSIIIGLFLCYVFYPLYSRLTKVVKRPNIAAFIMTVAVSLVILVPLVLLIQLIIVELLGMYGNFNLETAMSWFSNYFDSEMQGVMSTLAKQALSWLVSLLSAFVLSIPQKVIKGFVIVVTMFVAFRGGKKLVGRFEGMLPIKDGYKKEFTTRIQETVDAIVFGIVVVSFLQAVAAMVGFYIFGVSSPALLGFLTFIASLLPIIGPAVIWVPMAVFLYFSGHISAAIGLAVYSLIVQNLLLDFIFKPKIIGDKGRISPLLVLLGIIGGVMAFGVVGILLGPVVLVLLLEFLKIYTGKNAFKS